LCLIEHQPTRQIDIYTSNIIWNHEDGGCARVHVTLPNEQILAEVRTFPMLDNVHLPSDPPGGVPAPTSASTWPTSCDPTHANPRIRGAAGKNRTKHRTRTQRQSLSSKDDQLWAARDFRNFGLDHKFSYGIIKNKAASTKMVVGNMQGWFHKKGICVRIH